MPGDPLRKVVPGQPRDISAATWNLLIDAARSQRDREQSRPGAAVDLAGDRTVALVRNGTANAVERFGVLALDGPIIGPDDALDQFESRVAFEGVTPDGATPAGRFVVCLEPIPEDGIGRAVLSGVAICKLDVPGAVGEYAEAMPGNTESLSTGDTGTARVLWAESSGTTRWAVVRLGDGSGAAVAPPGGTPAWVKITVDYTDVDIASGSINHVVYDWLAGVVIHDAIVRPTESWANTGDVTVTARLTTSGDSPVIVPTSSLKTTITGTTFQMSSLSPNTSFLNSFTDDRDVYLTIDMGGGGTLDSLTAGSVDIYILASTLP